ncbi:MAG TPA: putative peptidoglycan binding domain-containing protein [Terriglobales bacterium]|nr:putative peptidoglycan binding domain-containing protein [Terriglobales bacterium]
MMRFWLSVVGCVALLAGAIAFATDTKTDSNTVPSTQAKAPSQSASAKKSSTSSSTTAHTSTHKGKKTRKSASRRPRGQQKIDSQRAMEIQEALIREHYLTGKPTGVWNDETQQAMQRYQADNNWQSKTTPDARALIKLGLGPDHQHLLNPESAMTSQPVTSQSVTQSMPGQPQSATPVSAADPGKEPR